MNVNPPRLQTSQMRIKKRLRTGPIEKSLTMMNSVYEREFDIAKN